MDDSATEVELLGTRIGKAIARDTLAEGMGREWTGLTPEDVDQIPAHLADHREEIERIARLAYEAALGWARQGDRPDDAD